MNLSDMTFFTLLSFHKIFFVCNHFIEGKNRLKSIRMDTYLGEFKITFNKCQTRIELISMVINLYRISIELNRDESILIYKINIKLNY